jgi:hypothetical protein
VFIHIIRKHTAKLHRTRDFLKKPGRNYGEPLPCERREPQAPSLGRMRLHSPSRLGIFTPIIRQPAARLRGTDTMELSRDQDPE